jgi:hypothetical protein
MAIAWTVLLASVATVSSASPLTNLVCKIDPRFDSGKLCARAPEIDPTSSIAGLTLMLGGLAVFRARAGRAADRVAGKSRG